MTCLILQPNTGQVVDSIFAFAYAVKNMYSDAANDNITAQSFSCDNKNIVPWYAGDTLLNYIKKVSAYGLPWLRDRLKIIDTFLNEVPSFLRGEVVEKCVEMNRF